MRKSRREKEKEREEEKKREEEERAAKAYAEFLDAFEGQDTTKKTGSNFVKAESRTAYAPSLKDKLEVPSRSPPVFDTTVRYDHDCKVDVEF